VELQILATDIDPEQLDRARTACYPRGSRRELPAAWVEAAFEEREGSSCLRPEFRSGVEFRQQDLRRELPAGPFDLVLCRNIVFTYFEEGLQREAAAALHERLAAGGALVLGIHEVLPAGTAGFHALEAHLPVYCAVQPERDARSIGTAGQIPERSVD
jgi:chemotaxis protein methyltransferase CheR